MAHGLNAMLKRGTNAIACKGDGKAGIGSRRIFAPQFKLQVLDSYRNDADCKGNQRATARKYGIHRRQIQKWLQVEGNLRNTVIKGGADKSTVINSSNNNATTPSDVTRKCEGTTTVVSVVPLRSEQAVHGRQRDDTSTTLYPSPLLLPPPPPPPPQPQIVPEAATAVLVDKRVPDMPMSPSPSPSHTHSTQWSTPPASAASSSTAHLPPAVPPSAVVACTTAAAAATGHQGTPLDYTTHSRGAAGVTASIPLSSARTAPCVPEAPRLSGPPEHTLPPATPPLAAPMDLSLRRPCVVTSDATIPTQSAPQRPTPAPTPQQAPPDVWDLSINNGKRKRPLPCDASSPSSSEDSDSAAAATPKPVKLFKPYLDHVDGDECSNGSETRPPVLYSGLLYGDNNNVSEYKDDGVSSFSCYYYPRPDSRSPPPHPLYCPLLGEHYPHQYDDKSYGLVRNLSQLNAIRQRQSYSLDFKLSAIECYYSDAVCRGNQRAVANKYRIHRRQVQKWLKQEEQLRQRNQTNKHVYIVR